MSKHDRFLDAGTDLAEIDHKKVKVATQYAGYGPDKMVADVNGVFKGGSFNPLHEVVSSTFEAECLQNFKFSKGSRLPSDARLDAIKHYKFFSRFSRSELRRQLLMHGRGNENEATRLFFESMGGGSASLEDLTELASKGKKELQEITAGGHRWGSGVGGLKAWLDLKKLVRYIKKDWDFAGDRSSQWRECLYPAEDVDYEQMQSYAQLTRVPTSAFAMKELVPELFKLNLATKQMQIRKYRERIPGPPKRFMICIDDSGSMFGHVPNKIEGETFSGVAWATAISIAICQAADGTDNKVSIAFFCNRIHGTASNVWFQGNAREAEKFLWTARWDGGGTDIGMAVQAGNTFHQKREEVEAFILITDCCGSYADTLKPLMPLYTVATEPKAAITQYDSGRWLERVSARMIYLNEVKRHD